MILKIIGIILLSILGLAIFIILILLFVPIRYRLRAYKGNDNDDYYVKINVSFLFHIVSASLVFDKELDIFARLFGIKVYDKNKKKDKATKKEDNSSLDDKSKEIGDTSNEEINESIEYSIDWNEQDSDKEDNKDIVSEENLNTVNANNSEDNKETLIIDESSEKKSKKEKSQDYESPIDVIVKKVKKLFEKIARFFDKGEKLYNKIVNKIDDTVNKIEYFDKMINDRRNKLAASKIFSQVKYILRKLAPRRAKGSIHFGFDDPATTGQILMYLGILAPFLPGNISYKPYFDEICLHGEIDIRGRFALGTLVIVLLRLLSDKNVRRLYRLYKSKKK